MGSEAGETTVLIGTVHLDPDGESVLGAALRSFQPGLITVDVSPYAVEFRRTRGKELLARLDPYRGVDGNLPDGLVAVAGQLEVPFEVRAAESHAARMGIPCRLLGDSDESRRRLKLLEEELFDPANLARLARMEASSPGGNGEIWPPSQTLAEQVRREWARARQTMVPGGRPEGAVRLAPGDDRMAACLRAQEAGGRLLHVTGWEHLPGLLQRLVDRHPQAFLLADLARPPTTAPP